MIYLIAFSFFIILIFIGIVGIFKVYEKKYILDLKSLPMNYDTIIVLGAGIRPDGTPCDILKDRLYTGAIVYRKNICSKVLLTGEARDINYNEVLSMKNWIMQYDIKEEDIILDGKGLCTYDSLYRAKTKFNMKNVIISTNRYHLPRAIYIARRLGINAVGVASDMRQYDRMKKYKRRELLAQIKDFLLVNFT